MEKERSMVLSPSLYEWQGRDVNRLRAGFNAYRSVVYVLPTGAGKTVVAGDIMQKIIAANPRQKILILVHRRELIRQFDKTLHQFGLDDNVGKISPDYPQTPWAHIQLASILSLIRRQLWFYPNLIIIDEAHHARAKTWETVLALFPKSRLLGLTATPKRLDGRGLGEHFEFLVEGPTAPELIGWGQLSPVRSIYADVDVDFTKIRKKAGNYDGVQAGSAMMQPAVMANLMRNFEAYCMGRKTLYFAPSIEHSKATSEKLRGMGIRAAHVDGSTDSARRDRLFPALASGDLQVLCNVDIASEGTDIPGCDCVLDGARTTSVTQYLQRIGRASRTAKGKTEGIYVDLVGNFHEHGAWDEPRLWGLDDDPSLGEPVDAGAKSSQRVCEHCSTLYRRSPKGCPHCGEIPSGRKVIELDIMLNEGGPTKPRKPKKAKLQQMIANVRRSPNPYRELRLIAKTMGYDAGWARATAVILNIPIPPE